MKRCLWTVLACATISCGISAANAATTTKAGAFEPAGAGMHETPFSAGSVSVSYSSRSNKTDLSLSADGLAPNTTYGVSLDSDLGGFSDPTAFTTNLLGVGQYHFSVPFNRTSHPVVMIYEWDGDTETIDEVSNDELRSAAEPVAGVGGLLNLLLGGL